MNAITLPYVLSVIAAVLVGRLISLFVTKNFRDKDSEFMNFEILTRVPLFALFFISTAFALQTPTINLGALHIESFSIATFLTYPTAFFLGLANRRYGVLKPFDPKELDGEAKIGLALLYTTVVLTLLTLLLLPAGGALVHGLAIAGGLAYLSGVVLLFKMLNRVFG
jgi:hypothetical protein